MEINDGSIPDKKTVSSGFSKKFKIIGCANIDTNYVPKPCKTYSKIR